MIITSNFHQLPDTSREVKLFRTIVIDDMLEILVTSVLHDNPRVLGRRITDASSQDLNDVGML